MYIIIKKDKAEDFSEKLHRIKQMACDVIEEMERASERSYGSREEAYHHSYSHHPGYDPYDREREERERFGRDYSRHGGYGRGGGRY